MGFNLFINDKSWRAKLDRVHDISIPVKFDGPQLSVFGVGPACAEPIISIRDGGSVNCESYTITPHCNGTHTECVGHFSEEKISILDVIKDTLTPAIVISVTPENARQGGDTYDPVADPDDLLITRAMIEKALHECDRDFLGALVIRTLPNGEDKKTLDYARQPPAFFSCEAMEYIAALPIPHLLVDMPSVDRLMDEGKLTNHHTFWGVPYGSHKVDPATASQRTITELIYVPPHVKDGVYLLNLQIAPFDADAASSRPLLYEIEQ